MSEPARAAQLRILAGIDLSERSRDAFLRAVQLAKAGGGSLTLVHVTSDAFPQKLVAERDRHARDVLEEHALKARAEGVGEVAQTIAYGRDYEQLIEHARKDRADLIVLGRHRPSSVLQDMLGTTVDRVLRLGGVPVLTVQQKVEQPYNSILVAVDFSPASRRAFVSANPAIFGMGRLMEAYNDMAPAPPQVRVFRDLSSAWRWLGLEEAASSGATFGR